MKGLSHNNTMIYVHVIWGVNPLRPILWIDVYERLNDTSKREFSLAPVNLTMRCVPSQKKGGSHFMISWGENHNSNFHREGF